MHRNQFVISNICWLYCMGFNTLPKVNKTIDCFSHTTTCNSILTRLFYNLGQNIVNYDQISSSYKNGIIFWG